MPAAFLEVDCNARDIAGYPDPNLFRDLGERQDLAGLHGAAHGAAMPGIVVARKRYRSEACLSARL